MDYTNIPREMRDRPQWVVHREKIPHSPRTGRRASVTDPRSWGTFQEACTALNAGSFSGLGFVFTETDDFVGVDFDHCINNGTVDPWVAAHVAALNSYTEISPSGTGLHVICRGTLPESVKTSRVELYNRGRYFTVTGNKYGTALATRNAAPQLAAIQAEVRPETKTAEPEKVLPSPARMEDEELIRKAENAQNGPAFRALMAGDTGAYGGDHSRADMALCNMLAFWTGGDVEQMDRIFRRSGLMREKWDRRQSGSTYGRLQLMKAAREQRDVYNPEQMRLDQARKDFETTAAPANGLQVFSAASLASKHLEPVRYFVEGMLPQGLALLSAPPKYGKSWFVLDLCISIATGADFLGKRTRRSACLYLALEDSENRLQERTAKVLAGRPAPDNFFFSIAAATLDNGLIDQLEQFLTQRPDTGVIVIDTLQKIRGSAGRTEGAYKYDYREMGQIKAFADRHHILVVLVHHLRKMADDTDPHNRISGTNGIMGAADTSMVLTRAKRGDDDTTLSITGRDIDTEDLVVRFNKDLCRWQLIGNTQQVARREAQSKYNDNPIVLTLRYLLQHSETRNKWTGNISKLITESRGFPFEIRETPRRVSNMLKDLEPDLEYYDHITFRQWKKGTNGGGHTYVFEQCTGYDFFDDWDPMGESTAYTNPPRYLNPNS